MDSGVDINHEDLKAVIWTNPKEIAGNNIDDDKNGYVGMIFMDGISLEMQFMKQLELTY